MARTRREVLRLVGASGAVVASAGLTAANSGDSAKANSDLKIARQATEQYHDVQNAREDGYMEEEHCVSGSMGDGAMGFHFFNPEYFYESGVDPEHPEVLVYEKRGGKYHLVAVEYASLEPFTLFGQDAHPPSDELPLHTLHAWIWKANPNGLFAGLNPTVRCPEDHE